MDYEKKYKEALGWIQSLYKGLHGATKEDTEHYFPELKESEDDRIKKEILDFLKTYNAWNKEWIVWLEKQCEQKPADKVEPKFKVGDWIVYETEGWREVLQIDTIDEHYTFTNGSSSTFDEEQYMRLWTIEDARDGDVLVTKEDNRPFIFNGLLDFNNPNCPVAYCGIDSVNLFLISPGNHWWSDKEVCPATKEQRDLLFRKMKEAGYEWDDYEKVLVGLDNDDEQYEELMEDDETDLSIEPINEYNTHEPTLEEVKEWNEAYEKGYSLGYENGKNERNPAWSEEDEGELYLTISLLDKLKEEAYTIDCENCINWLKSLKPQPHWKPTDEQIDALDKVYKTHGADCECRHIILGLLNELKKL